jgi:hypothetical protein
MRYDIPTVKRSIGLLGDVMLGRGVADRLAAGAPDSVWAPELIEITSTLELLVCNLECVVSDRGQPTELIKSSKHPFFFRAPPQAVVSLRTIGVDAVGIANNHALDFGSDGLSDTIRHLQDAGIGAAGAGEGTQGARRGIVATGPSMRVGLLAVSDHPPEFAAAPGRLGISYAALRKDVPAWPISRSRVTP